MAESYEVLEIEPHADHTATLWLANPERRNAMGPAFWRELPQAMAALGADPEVRAVVLAARGSAFTVGLDLKLMMGALAESQNGGGKLGFLDEIRRLQASISAVAACPKPVVAAIHGWCIGGGVDLVTACDVRYAAADAVFSVRETRMAMVADIGTLQRLPGIVGRGHVAELAFSGDDVDAERAREIHLVNRVFPTAAAAVEEARALAARIAANSPLAVAGTKRVLAFCAGKSVEEGLEYVATWNAAFFHSEDLGEAMQAFFEKRKPEFRGR